MIISHFLCCVSVLFYVDAEVAFFGDNLDKYHREHKEALAIKQKRPLGILLVDTTQLKDRLIPSPLHCIEVTHCQKHTH